MTEQASMVGAVRGDRREYDSDELDRLIEKRAKHSTPREQANEREAIWRTSEEAHRAEVSESYRWWQWVTYFEKLSGAHSRLSEHFEAKAEEARRGLPTM